MDKKLRVSHHTLLATDIWDVRVVDGFPAANMNLGLVPKVKSASDFGGFGIYSISYKHPQHGDRVIYLGKFAGRSSKVAGVDMASQGDVRDRWFKHIGTATLLLSKLKMGSERFYREKKADALAYFRDDEQFKAIYPSSFLGIPENTLKTSVFVRGVDLQVSRNRLAFAIQNLTSTNRVGPSNAEELLEVISRFTCHYWRVIPTPGLRKSTINQALTGTGKTPGVESTLIEIYGQKLPMNHQYDPASFAKSGFFHYDPEALIQIDSTEFKIYSDRVKTALTESFP